MIIKDIPSIEEAHKRYIGIGVPHGCGKMIFKILMILYTTTPKDIKRMIKIASP